MNILPQKLALVHDPLAAFGRLVAAADMYNYMARRLIKIPYARDVAIAAVAFTCQAAIEYGYEVETIRAMERDLIARLESEA